eukprot:551495-Hanusia_phi.AAC.2
MENYEQCFQDFDVATQLNPNDPNYFFNRGNAYLTIRNVEQALSDLDEAISLAQSIPAYYHSKGVAFQALGRKAGAIEMFDKALSLNPKVPASASLSPASLPAAPAAPPPLTVWSCLHLFSIPCFSLRRVFAYALALLHSRLLLNIPLLHLLRLTLFLLQYHAEGQHEQAAQMFSAVIRLVPQVGRSRERGKFLKGAPFTGQERTRKSWDCPHRAEATSACRQRLCCCHQVCCQGNQDRRAPTSDLVNSTRTPTSTEVNPTSD